MMVINKKIIILIVLCFIIPISIVIPESSWLLYGTIRWPNGSPAVSVVVKLFKADDNVLIRQVFSNQRGQYGFYGIPGNPDEYRIEVGKQNNDLHRIELRGKGYRRGQRIDIELPWETLD
jgi:hypothetical protein